MKIKSKVYMHSSKETMREFFADVCIKNNIEPSEKAIDRSVYACYEIAIDVIWDTDTGGCEVIGASSV